MKANNQMGRSRSGRGLTWSWRALLYSGVACTLLLTSSVVTAQYSRCSGIQSETLKTACFRKEAERASIKLDRYVTELNQELNGAEKLELERENRLWRRWRDQACERASRSASREAQVSSAENTSIYQVCVFQEAVRREEFLRAAFGGEGVSSGLKGHYSDGRSHRVTITSEGDTMKLIAELNSGEAFREIRGEFDPGATIRLHSEDCGMSAAEENEASGGTYTSGVADCCVLTLTFSGNRLRSHERCDSQILTPAFTGTFRKIE